MKVMHLEIDSEIRELLTSKLSAVGMLAMSVKSKKARKDELSPREILENSDSFAMGIEIFAEPEAFSRIIKTIVRLGRDGLINNFPIRILSIRSVA